MEKLLERYPSLRKVKGDLEAALALMTECYENGGKILLAGNGGSYADCEHISGELMKSFLLPRRINSEKRAKMLGNYPNLDNRVLDKLELGLPAIPLASLGALTTAYSNDADASLAYAQAVMALGKEGDLLIAISTSGSSVNICRAAEVARGLGMRVLALTGEGGGAHADIASVAVKVPECETYLVQQLHLPVYHWLCAATEKYFFAET